MKEPHVGNAVLNHDETLDTEAECETLVFFRVNAGVRKHLRVHHAGAHYLEPLPLYREPYIHFDRRFREWEVAWPQAYFRFTAEILLAEPLERALQMRERDIGVNGQAFELVELGFVRRIRRFVTENFPRHDNARRRALLLEPA